MIFRRVSIFALVLCSLLTIQVGAVEGQSNYFTMEGYVFSAETLRPVENVTVRLYQTLVNGSYIETPTITDANGSFVVSTLANLDGVQLIVTATCRTARGKVGSQSLVRKNQAATPGATYQKNLYIKLPRGISGCLADD